MRVLLRPLRLRRLLRRTCSLLVRSQNNTSTPKKPKFLKFLMTPGLEITKMRENIRLHAVAALLLSSGDEGASVGANSEEEAELHCKLKVKMKSAVRSASRAFSKVGDCSQMS